MQIDKIEINSSDYASLKKLIEKYKDCEPFEGINENGNKIFASFSEDNITIHTYQSNGWIRVNTYWPYKETREERYIKGE